MSNVDLEVAPRLERVISFTQVARVYRLVDCGCVIPVIIYVNEDTVDSSANVSFFISGIRFSRISAHLRSSTHTRARGTCFRATYFTNLRRIKIYRELKFIRLLSKRLSLRRRPGGREGGRGVRGRFNVKLAAVIIGGAAFIHRD